MPEKTDSPFPARSERTTSSASAESQLKGFIDKFEPRHQTLIRAARKAMRRRLPTAFELAYDNYNFRRNYLTRPEIEAAPVRGDLPGKDPVFSPRAGVAYHSLHIRQATSPTPRRLTTFEAKGRQEGKP